MPQGRRYGPDSPSPTASSLAQYIREHGVDIEDKHVAAVWYFHPEWQPGHAEQVRKERAVKDEERQKEKAAKAEAKVQKDKEKAEAKAKKEAESADRKAKKEAEGGADGDDTPVDGEPAKTSRRLRTRGESQEQPVAAGVSEASF